MNALKNKLKVDNYLTKPRRKTLKGYTKVKDNIPPIEDHNYMADLLELPLDRGYKYLLVVVDLWSDEFDIEPLKRKTPAIVLNGLKKMFKRSHLNKPKGSITTDGGSEFKGVFHKYMYNNNIYHKTTLPKRHTQVANVERLNRVIGELLNGYMNAKEEEVGHIYNGWTEVIDLIRKDLNHIRKKPNKDPFTYDAKTDIDLTIKPKFREGDVVHRLLDAPQNALGHNQPTENFRSGDYRYERHPRKIVKVLPYSGAVPYRYLLEGIKEASFTKDQLIITKTKAKETKWQIKKILKSRKKRKKIEYLVWWLGYLKKDATWQQITDLTNDEIKQLSM